MLRVTRRDEIGWAYALRPPGGKGCRRHRQLVELEEKEKEGERVWFGLLQLKERSQLSITILHIVSLYMKLFLLYVSEPNRRA